MRRGRNIFGAYPYPRAQLAQMRAEGHHMLRDSYETSLRWGSFRCVLCSETYVAAPHTGVLPSCKKAGYQTLLWEDE